METPAKFIPALSGLRFIAALCVLVGHFSGWLIPIRPTPPLVEYFAQNLTIIGMPLFFVLSGFIMQHVYGMEFSGGIKASAVGRFAFARFSRLYPLYALFIAVQFAYAYPARIEEVASDPSYLRALLAALTMTQTWANVSIHGTPIHEIYWGINWSISTEVFFYVAFPIIALALSRITAWRSAAITLVAVVLASYAYEYAIYSRASADHVRWLGYFSPYGRLPEFITGCVTCRLSQTLGAPSRGVQRYSGSLTGVCALGIAALWLAFGSVAYAHAETSAGLFVFLHQNYMMAPFIAGLIFSCARYESWLQRFLASAALIYLGEISYSIYLAHPLVPSMIHASAIHTEISRVSLAHYALVMLIGAALTIAMASGLYKLVEVSSRHFLRASFVKLHSRTWRRRRLAARTAHQE